MLFWTKKCKIKNKQIFSNLTPVLDDKVRYPIKHTQHLAQFLRNHKISIGYGSSKVEDD